MEQDTSVKAPVTPTTPVAPVKPDASTTQDAPVAPTINEKQKSGKGLKIATAIACAVAVCGIGFGIYGMLQSLQKDSQISDLKTQVEELNTKEDIPEYEEIIIDDSVVERKNPIISATAPTFYSIGFTSGNIVNGAGGEYSLNLYVRNGEIASCNVNSIETKVVGSDVVRNTRVLNDCSINGLTGKVYKVVEIGEGQDASNDSVAFIMEDGSVEYLSLSDALLNSDFNIEGKLKIDGFVVDALTVNVGQEGASTGGYGSTIFVLVDGSYVKYDNSMVE